MANEWIEKEAAYERAYMQNRTATDIWKYIPEKVRAGVTAAFSDPEGYWVWLDYENGGWSAYDHGADCGTIHEYTIKDLRAAIKTIKQEKEAK